MEKNTSLEKITTCLYIIIALLFLNTILLTISLGDKKESTTGTEETETLDYDVSAFISLTTDQFLNQVNESGYQVIYIGRSSCGFCAKILPVLEQAQEEYNYTTLYYDITQIIDFENQVILDEEKYDKILALHTYVDENFGATPMILIYKDGQYINGTVGYMEYSDFATFLEESGITK